MDIKYFPRGGATKTSVIDNTNFVFEKKKSTKVKKSWRKDKQSFIPLNKPNLHLIPRSKLHSSHFHLVYQNIRPGLLSICAVHEFKGDGLIVNLPYGKKATVLNSSISSSYSENLDKAANKKELKKMFFVGQLLCCKVLKCEDNKNLSSKIYATLNPSDVNRNINAGMITANTMIQMAVSSIEDHGYSMDCGVPGVMAFLPFKQAASFCQKILDCEQPLGLGTVLWCYITKSSLNGSGSNVVEVSIDPSLTSNYECDPSTKALWPGARVNATITEVLHDNCCKVSVDGTDIIGSVSPLLDHSKDISTGYTVGTSSPATIMLYDPISDSYNFSFSHHVGKTHLPHLYPKPKERFSHHEATIDEIDKNFMYLSIQNKLFKGMLSVNHPSRRTGINQNDVNHEENTELSENKTSSLNYQPGEKILVQIKFIDFLCYKYECLFVKKISMKMNKNETQKQVKGVLDVDEIKQESEYDYETDTNLNGTKKTRNPKKQKTKSCEIDEVKDESDSDIDIKDESDSDIDIKDEIDSDIEISDEIKSNLYNKCQNKDSNKRIVEEHVSDHEAGINEPSNKKRMKRKHSKLEVTVESTYKKVKSSNGNVAEKETLSKHASNKLNAASQRFIADADSHFMWDATPEDLARVTSNNVEEFNEESDEEKASIKPSSKKNKKINELEKERMLREKEEELLKALEEPKSADHYERLILSRPDDSRIWIQYMSFHLEATEIEKARIVGKRALQLISHRNEQEKLNVWLALLNLEYLYGSKDSFKETWSESLKYNDDYKVNCKVLDLFANGSNTVEVTSLVQRMTKDYKENCDCWHICLSALMSVNMPEKARDLLQRALKSLPTKFHVNLISRFALIENRHGFREESQSLFDNLVSSYPARVDIWFVYLDMLIKSNLKDLARQVFERATSQKLPARKMKSVYKKWLEFENKHGTADSVEMVRESAIQYVEEATKDVGK